MAQVFQVIDPYIEKLHLTEFNSIKPLQVVTQKIGMGCQPAHLVLISFTVTALLVLLNIGSFVLSSFVGFLYPAYMSFKALQSKGLDDDKQWLTYWVVFSFFTCFDNILSMVLFFLPCYYFFKLAFYVYLFHPSTKGAIFIYDSFLRKFLLKYESSIDKTIQEGKEKIGEAVDTAKSAAN